VLESDISIYTGETDCDEEDDECTWDITWAWDEDPSESLGCECRLADVAEEAEEAEEAGSHTDAKVQVEDAEWEWEWDITWDRDNDSRTAEAPPQFNEDPHSERGMSNNAGR